MRKRILLAALVLSLGMLSSCRPCPPCPESCGWAPFTELTVTYRLNTGTVIDRFNVPGNGCVTYSSRCLDCNGNRIEVMGRRRSSFFGLFSVSPDPINLQAPPGTLTIYGYGISAAYGMPTIECLDPYGRRVSTTMATSVAGDGSWVQINLPDLSHAYTGQFQVLVVNRTWDGGQEEMGYSPINLWGRNRVDADGDGWFLDEDCDDNNPSINPLASPDCNGPNSDLNCNGVSDYDECNLGGGGGGGGGGGDPCGETACTMY